MPSDSLIYDSSKPRVLIQSDWLAGFIGRPPGRYRGGIALDFDFLLKILVDSFQELLRSQVLVRSDFFTVDTGR